MRLWVGFYKAFEVSLESKNKLIAEVHWWAAICKIIQACTPVKGEYRHECRCVVP